MIIKDEITNTYERQKYGSVKGDYWTNLTDKEMEFMCGRINGFSRTKFQ